jgi:hypothetical protein
MVAATASIWSVGALPDQGEFLDAALARSRWQEEVESLFELSAAR